ncbi:hypothetical protein BU17DRAFT_64344 [Hysterangium stoloniferum]|nr:hypothetical protein BU17DRAFT_64344 [Hysterangium stoloniferum]
MSVITTMLFRLPMTADVMDQAIQFLSGVEEYANAEIFPEVMSRIASTTVSIIAMVTLLILELMCSPVWSGCRRMCGELTGLILYSLYWLLEALPTIRRSIHRILAYSFMSISITLREYADILWMEHRIVGRASRLQGDFKDEHCEHRGDGCGGRGDFEVGTTLPGSQTLSARASTEPEEDYENGQIIHKSAIPNGSWCQRAPGILKPKYIAGQERGEKSRNAEVGAKFTKVMHGDFKEVDANVGGTGSILKCYMGHVSVACGRRGR